MCVCFITAGPITKLCAWGEDGTREEPGTLTQGAPPQVVRELRNLGVMTTISQEVWKFHYDSFD